MRFELSERAERDIADITRYTFENFGKGQVDEYIDGLFQSFEILAQNPNMGRPYEGVPVRRYIYRSHLVYYQAREDEGVIRIAHVRHSAMQEPSGAELAIDRVKK